MNSPNSIDHVRRYSPEMLLSTSRDWQSIMQKDNRKSNRSLQRIKWRSQACERIAQKKEISAYGPGIGGRFRRHVAMHHSIKWLSSGISRPITHHSIYEQPCYPILISNFTLWYLCSNSRFGSPLLGKLSALFYLASMADHNLCNIKASQALRRAKDFYEASVSKRGHQTIEVLQEEVDKSRARIDDSAISEEVDWLVDPGTPSTRNTQFLQTQAVAWQMKTMLAKAIAM